MASLLWHIFDFAESYTVTLLWIIVPIAGLYGFGRVQRNALQSEGKDAENRRAS